MDYVTCPSCDTRLSEPEQLDGWCESCGKSLPPHISAAAAKHHRLEHRRIETDPFAGATVATPVKSRWSWHW